MLLKISNKETKHIRVYCEFSDDNKALSFPNEAGCKGPVTLIQYFKRYVKAVPVYDFKLACIRLSKNFSKRFTNKSKITIFYS